MSPLANSIARSVKSASAAEVIEMFVHAMETAGVVPRDRGEVAGKLAAAPGVVRFVCVGERKANGWARLFLDDSPAGSFGNWRTATKGTWRHGGSVGRVVYDGAAVARRVANKDAARLHAFEDVAAKCLALWEASSGASNAHPYVVGKRMVPTGLRQSRGAVLVPMTDGSGRLWNMQCIYPDGSKRFAVGGRVKGLMWQSGEVTDAIAIGEGVATMAAVNAATGLHVVAALSASNLATAAVEVRRRHPSALLIICADDDANRDPNVGIEAATAAARDVGGWVARPPRPRGLPNGQGWDFADAWIVRGGAGAICQAVGFKNGGMA